MSRLPILLAGVCSAICGALLATLAYASGTNITVYSYAAKFVCEEENDNDVSTNVNIHNPSLNQTAEFFAKIVIPDYGFDWVDGGLIEPDEANSFECDSLQEVTVSGLNPSDFEGFLVVLSKKPLDVVAVYEAAHGELSGSEEKEDLDVVAVTPQKVVVPQNVWNNLIPDL